MLTKRWEKDWGSRGLILPPIQDQQRMWVLFTRIQYKYLGGGWVSSNLQI